MSPGKRDLVRYREVRRADALDDQKSALDILAADSTLTQEQLQELVLSQLKRVIWGARVGRWNDDFLTTQIPSLADLSQVFEATCEATDAVDMYVRVTGPAVSGVRQVSRVDITDRTKMPAIGVIIEKMTLTRCRVRTYGEVPAPIVAIPGKRYFVGLDSQLTDSPPRPGPGGKIATQIIGVALDRTTILVSPNLNYIVQVGD